MEDLRASTDWYDYNGIVQRPGSRTLQDALSGGTPCARPNNGTWCTFGGSIYIDSVDCDADGLPDPVCYSALDAQGPQGVVLSNTSCVEQWPNAAVSTCLPVFGPVGCLRTAPVLGRSGTEQAECAAQLPQGTALRQLWCPLGAFISRVVQATGRASDGTPAVLQMSLECSDGSRLGPVPDALPYKASDITWNTYDSDGDGFLHIAARTGCVAAQQLAWRTAGEGPLVDPPPASTADAAATSGSNTTTAFACIFGHQRISALALAFGEYINTVAPCCSMPSATAGAALRPDAVPGLQGWWDGSSWDAERGVWADVAGTGNNASLVRNPGAAVQAVNGSYPYLTGNRFAAIVFPRPDSFGGGVLPASYTLIHISHYIGNGDAQGRIITAADAPQPYSAGSVNATIASPPTDTRCRFVSGFATSQAGVAQHAGVWLTPQQGEARVQGRWLLSVDSWTSYRAQGHDRTLKDAAAASLPAGGPQESLQGCVLGVNALAGVASAASDWGVAAVLLYGRQLSSEEVRGLEVWLYKNLVQKLPAAAPAAPAMPPLPGPVLLAGSSGTVFTFSEATRRPLPYQECRSACLAANATPPLARNGSLMAEALDVQRRAYAQGLLAQYGGWWLGLVKKYSGGPAVWEDGQELAGPGSWADGEPSNSYGWEDCVEASADTGVWSDTACVDAPRTCMCTQRPEGSAGPLYSQTRPAANPTDYGSVITVDEKRFWAGSSQQLRLPTLANTCSYVCKGVGGALPVASSPAQQATLVKAVQLARGAGMIANGSVWIGLQRVAQPDGTEAWQWADGSRLGSSGSNFSSWAQGQPDNGNSSDSDAERCAELQEGSWQWGNLPCACGCSGRSCMCELPPAPPPPPPPPGSPAGAIAGAVVGGVVLLATAVLLVVLWRRRSSRQSVAAAAAKADASGGVKAAGEDCAAGATPDPATGSGSISSGSNSCLRGAAAPTMAVMVTAGCPVDASTPNKQQASQTSCIGSADAVGDSSGGCGNAQQQGSECPPFLGDPCVAGGALARPCTVGEVGVPQAQAQGQGNLSPELQLQLARDHPLKRPSPAPAAAALSGTPPVSPRRQQPLPALPEPSASSGMAPYGSGWRIAPEELSLQARLGGGGYGEVFRGLWRGTHVAVKLVAPELLEDREAGGRCMAELALMCQLHHPNIVHTYGAAALPTGHLAIVMELAGRGSLYDLLHRSSSKDCTGQQQQQQLPLEPRRRLRMALDVAKGMEYLHGLSPPLVHRDIKSPNLLVAADWSVKVCDFGLSKPKHATFISTVSGAGTPAWMAPEVLMGRRCDEKSDVYSFGIVLYELATGRVPWCDGEDAVQHNAQLYHRVGQQGLRPTLPEGLDEGLVRLIRSCWDQEPEARPSFAEIRGLLAGMRELRPAAPEVVAGGD